MEGAGEIQLEFRMTLVAVVAWEGWVGGVLLLCPWWWHTQGEWG